MFEFNHSLQTNIMIIISHFFVKNVKHLTHLIQPTSNNSLPKTRAKITRFHKQIKKHVKDIPKSNTQKNCFGFNALIC